MTARASSRVSNSSRQTQRCLSFCEPGLDERLALGVAVAAATVRDLVLGETGSERARRERGAVVGAERQLARTDPPVGDRDVDDGGRLGRTAADVQRPADE